MHDRTKSAAPGLLLLLQVAVLTGEAARGQGSRADYERAAALRARTDVSIPHESIEPRWIDGGARLWYRRDGAAAPEYVLVDAGTGRRSALFEPERLARAVREATGRAFDTAAVRRAQVAVEGDDVYVLPPTGLEAFAYDRERGAVRVVSLGDVPALHRPAETRVRRSRSGRGATTVLFGNGTEGPLSIFWVDEGRQRHPYGEIAPGAVHRQPTHARHAWVLVDGDGRDRAAFVAPRGDAAVAWVGPGTPRPGAAPARGGVPTPPVVRVLLRDHNVWIKGPEDDAAQALTTDGTAERSYVGRQWVSPDGTKLVVMRTDAGDERRVHYVEAAPRDRVQPRLHSYAYLKPGDRLSVSKPHLFDLAARAEIPVDDALFDTPWSIRDVRWSPDSRRFTFLYNQRGHQALRVVAVDAQTGAARAIVDETSPTFIDYSQKQVIRFLERTNEIIWSSERDGWHHLYLYDAARGRLKNRITTGDWVVRGVDRIDEEKREIWFRASGIHPEQDPYHVHHARVGFDGRGLTILTEGDGTHTVSYSPDGRYFVDRYSRVDLPPVTELRRARDGRLVCELERADWSALLATGWRPPRRFSAKGRDGVTDIWGLIRYPTDHDPARRYPVIEAIYAGPHGAHVPKAFHRHSPHAELAELGFVVVQIDGMGTNFRSKAFHDVCWRNLGDSGFPDRIRWIEAAARADASLDLSRVGIFGGSAGGQSAVRAVLAHGDFYHAAAADCGCHDNRLDKIWWNEAWMGWPVGPHYEAQSNVTQAHRLEGKLLLTVGAMDENVDPASTMQVVQALIDADKDFELIVFPRGGHGAGGSPYGRRRRSDFFVRSLLGVEPRWDPTP